MQFGISSDGYGGASGNFLKVTPITCRSMSSKVRSGRSMRVVGV